MLKKISVFILLFVAIFLLTATCAEAQSKYFGNWAPGTSPKEIGKRLAENFLKRDFEFESGKRPYVIYPEICAWYGALTIAEETKDKDLRERLTKKFDRFLTADGARNISQQAHVDYRVFGVVPLELFMQTKDSKYLTLGQPFADKQWEKPTDDGITAEARYWIDDMYMITAVQTQAYRATKDKKYLDRAALAAGAYLDKL
ncbi:MAG: glycoside hydrolase family 88 protein, partial [Actinomycetota bacterium]